MDRTAALLLLWFVCVLIWMLPVWKEIINSHIGANPPAARTWNVRRRRQIGTILAVVLSLVPLGQNMLDQHPCVAWCCWGVSALAIAYVIWLNGILNPWIRLAALATCCAALVGLAWLAWKSIYTHTELSFFFVDPGVFIVERTGEWLLIVSGENTRKPLLGVEMYLADEVTAAAVPNEPDQAKRLAMIRGSRIQKEYSEIDSYFGGDRILWRPIDVNDQHYSVQARYRIGDTPFLNTEDIRIVNVGPRFISSQQQTDTPVWQFAVTVRNQAGVILMRCVDSRLRNSDKTVTPAIPTCFPGANYKPLPRPLCARCFGRGFEFYR